MSQTQQNGTCKYCDDGDGDCIYPYYGNAPHSHDEKGRVVTLPKDQWGDNFREDPDCEGCGVFMRCPECGSGEQTKNNL